MRTDNSLGYGYISLAVGGLLLSNILIQDYLVESKGFKNMITVSVVGAIPSFCLWSVYARRIPSYGREYMIRAVPMSAIALISSAAFNMSLSLTSMSMATVVSSSSSIFTLIFEMWLLKERVNVTTAIAAVLSLMGCAMVTLEAAGNNSNLLAVSPDLLGICLALLSAAASGLFAVLLRLYDITDIAFFIPCLSTCLLASSPILLPLVHLTGLETYRPLSTSVLGLILLNGCLAIGINFWQMRAISILSPVIVNVFLSLMIPCSMVIDYFVKAEHKLNGLFVIGSSIVFGSVILVATAPPLKPPSGERAPLASFHATQVSRFNDDDDA